MEDRPKVKARYIEIKDDILSKIQDGTYAPGEIIPTEQELSALYGVSRPTIRQALQILATDGYIDKRKRRGTVVCEPKIEQGFATQIRSFEEEMRSANKIARTRVILSAPALADDEVVSALGLEQGAHVLKLVRVRYADNLPNVFVTTFIPLDLYPGIADIDFEHQSLYATLRAMGNPVVRAHRKLDVGGADTGTAAILSMEEGAPVFVFHTVATDVMGRPCEYSIATYNGATNSFEFTTDVMAQTVNQTEQLIG